MATSALIGNAPANQNDFDIIKGTNAQAGMTNADPSKGVALSSILPVHPSLESKAVGICVGLAMAIVVIFAITGGRILARYQHKVTKFVWDDAINVVATVGTAGWLAIAITMVSEGGLGQHTYKITYQNYYKFAKLSSINLTVFYVTIGFAQLSIMGFNQRLVGDGSRKWKWTNRILFVAISCYIVAALFSTILMCNPPAAAESLIIYGQHVNDIKCLNKNIMTIALNTINLTFAATLLLIPIIYTAQMVVSTTEKFGALMVATVGVFTVVASAVRLTKQTRVPDDITCKLIQYHGIGVPFNESLDNWINNESWTMVSLMASVHVTSLLAIGNAVMAYIKGQNVSETDEFGRRFAINNFYRHQNLQRNPSAESIYNLTGTHGIALQHLPTAHTASRNSSSATLPDPNGPRVTLQYRDFPAAYLSRVGRTQMDNQSFDRNLKPAAEESSYHSQLSRTTVRAMAGLEDSTPSNLPNNLRDPGEGPSSSAPHAM